MLGDKELVAMKIQMLEFLVQRLFFELFRHKGDPLPQIQSYAEAMRQSLEDSFVECADNPAAAEAQLAITEMLNAFWDTTIARARVTAGGQA